MKVETERNRNTLLLYVILSGECEAFGVELLRVEVQSTEQAKVLGGTPSRIY
jgi:hypothetical protein